MKRSVQTTKIVEEVIRQKPKARWLFLTLSVKNVFDGDQLDKSLKEMAIGFNRLMKYKKVAKNMIGFMRSTEITVNEKYGSYKWGNILGFYDITQDFDKTKKSLQRKKRTNII